MKGSIDPWLATLLRSLDGPERSPFGDHIPDYPPTELQLNTTGLSSVAALKQAYAFRANVLDAVGKAGAPLRAESKLLDFGFGWGRISRVFMGDVRVRNIYGIDVDPDFVALTSAAFGTGNFSVCPPFPPTAFPDGEFALVVAYSVFSHLSGAACHLWMEEFRRLLEPGGVVVFTTRHESFFDYCAASARDPGAEGYRAELGRLFPDINAAKAAYRKGQLVHASSEGVSGGGPRNSSFYGETWIPEAYARTMFGPGFKFVAGYFDPAKYDQAAFALRRVP